VRSGGGGGGMVGNNHYRTVRKRSHQGQVLIEMVLVFILFMAIFFGLFDLAHAYFNYATLTEACRSAVRNAVVQPYDGGNLASGIGQDVADVFSAFRFWNTDAFSSGNVTCTVPSIENLTDTPITVEAEVSISLIVLDIFPGIPEPFVIRTSTSAYYEIADEPNESMFSPDEENDTGVIDPTDTDGDGLPDVLDAFPGDPTETQDTDNDGIGDNTDEDDDNDSLDDIDDPYPLSIDGDQDGYTDAEEIENGTDPTNRLDPLPIIE